ncbi:MAG: hypothetical protein AB7O21_17675 [Gammaproteobacteria bacterium]
MTVHAPLAYLFATEWEAHPFLAALDARPVPGRGDLYAARSPAREYVLVMVSGIGLANATRAATALLRESAPRHVVNAGIAGALGTRFALGDVAHVEAVAEAADAGVPAAEFLALVTPPHGLPRARLVSRAAPVFDRALRAALAVTADLVDMEGAAVARACAAAGVPCTLLKAVSDFADDRATLHRHLAFASRRLADSALGYHPPAVEE